jgi:hypothetical protein
MAEWELSPQVGEVIDAPMAPDAGNAVAMIFAKDPAELTRDDAMTVSCRWALYSCQYAKGNGVTIDAVGGDYDTMTWLGHVSKSWIMPVHAHSHTPATYAFLERLCLLLLDIFRNPRGASPLALAGAAMALGLACSGRAELSMALIKKARMLEVMVEKLHEAGSPVDWASWRDWNVGPLSHGRSSHSVTTLCILHY